MNIQRLEINQKMVYSFYIETTILNQMRTEKITLTLNTELLKRLAKKANLSKSAFVRALIAREASQIEQSFDISEEIMELKGCLASSDLPTKDRVKQSAKKKICLNEN